MILKKKVLIIDNMLYYRQDGVYVTHLGRIPPLDRWCAVHDKGVKFFTTFRSGDAVSQ